MTLESLVEEIRRRGEAELAAVEADRAARAAALVEERDRKVAEIRGQVARATDTDVARERAQRVAAAKLQARKLLYEARESRLGAAVEETRALLQGLTGLPDYASVLRRMHQAATEALGRSVRVSGRKEDAGLLAKVAGRSFDPTPQPILGGLIAETTDGARRLNLSFDELLRLREDQVRELLA